MSGEAARSERPGEQISPQRLRGAATVKLNLTCALGIALCALAFWFELGRAMGGNSLSWAYVFEWPLLACFAAYMWWRLRGGHPAKTASPGPETQEVAAEYRGMLAAWQEHQARLAALQAKSEDPT